MKFIKQISPVLLLFVLPYYPLFAQNRAIDSLRNLLRGEPNDTEKIKSLNVLAYLLIQNKPDSTIILAVQADTLAQKLGWERGVARAYYNMGYGYFNLGDFPKALEYYQNALTLNEKLDNKTAQATDLCSIGRIYATKGESIKALDYYLKALKLDEDSRSSFDQAIILGNIGNNYADRKDYANALDYDKLALKINENFGNKAEMAVILGNIGNIYNAQGNLPKALDYYTKSYGIFDSVGDKRGEAFDLGNIGDIYEAQRQYITAENYLKSAIAIDSAVGEKFFMQQFEGQLCNLYEKTGNYKLALYWDKKSTAIHDTLFSMDKDKALLRKEMIYRFQQHADSAKSVQDKIDAVHNEVVKRQKAAIFSISGGLILVLLLAITIFRSLQQNRKKTAIITAQKIEVEKKNIQIEEKSKDIIDSINYAKRLQDAILPSVSQIKQYFPESFVLYKPKDIVAGDFYWVEKLDDIILIAACDCTGHGVPGAIVSVVCSNSLNRAVREFNLYEPAKILDKTRELVLETFSASDKISDGMDISLAAVKVGADGSLEKTISWSGANNPLLIIPPPIWGQKAELHEVMPDKQPIGYFPNITPFNNNVITFSPLRSNTLCCLYLFTDGYADQFGGPKGKKYKYKQLKELLLSHADKPMEEQKNILEQEFNRWKGGLEQTDDVCMIGIKI